MRRLYYSHDIVIVDVRIVLFFNKYLGFCCTCRVNNSLFGVFIQSPKFSIVKNIQTFAGVTEEIILSVTQL